MNLFKKPTEAPEPLPLETYQPIYQAAAPLFAVLDNLLHSIPPGEFKDFCRDAMHSTAMICSSKFRPNQLLLLNIGDACRHSAHIPEAPGQGGISSHSLDHELLPASSEPDSPKYSIFLTRHQKDFIRTALIQYSPVNDFEHDCLDEIQNLFLAAKPLNSELVNLTLDEQELILVSIESFKKLDPSLYPQGVYQYLSDGFRNLYHKILSIVPDSPEVPGNVDYMQCHSPD